MDKPTETKQRLKGLVMKLLMLGFWLLLWQLVYLWVGHDLLLSSPLSVFLTVLDFLKDLDFWKTILFSSLRIIAGFLLSLVIGVILSVASYKSRWISELIAPLMRIIKATPVASFIILALIWINSRNLSVLISFLMVVPVVYMNVLQGLHETDRKLLEMAKIFHITRRKMITSIYIPSVMPYLITSVTVGLGFCWKSGIAAEVIGRPSGSIGERLYEAKLYIMTKELFAWTFVIIIISVLFEKIVMLLLQLLKKDRVNHNS